MTAATTSLSRADALVLVRILAAPARGLPPGQLRKSLEPFFQHRLSTADCNEQLDQSLERLVEAGLVTRRPLQLTEDGRRTAGDFLGMSELPARPSWTKVKNAYLLAVALEMPAGRRVALADGLRAAVLRRQHQLSTAETPTLNQALDALAWKQLNRDSAEPFTREAVIAYGLGMARFDRQPLKAQLPAQALGARNSSIEELRIAVLRSWLDPRPAAPVSFNLAGFAEAVREAARECPTGRFGDRKVFIGHVWRWLQERRAFPGMDEAEFKRRLTEAQHAGLLSLSRADLVEAMNPDDVRSSETSYLNATFHFVQL